MGDLSRHFSRREFACHCGCGYDTVDAALLKVLEDVRRTFNAPVTINSGCRCEKHNAKIGGSEHSQHKLSRAADIAVEGIPAEAVHDWLVSRYPDKFGIGKYNTFTHIDTRTDGPARWDKT